MSTTSPSLEVAPALPLAAVHEVRDRCLCLAAQRAARLLAQRFDRLFAPLGITNGHFSILVALSGGWKPRLGELAAFLAMDKATLTAAVRVLERRGLVIVRPDDGDARIRRPSLTEIGRETVGRAVPLWREEHARLEAGLDAADVASATRLLSRLG
ncbi:MarR family transcriptional regulator [Kaistia algarum]|uniref:MarR family winged helix-turn-helix transcriptional regulator n=1 Tax=Kaistia algarum TaxID=2083279 RepID=UPI000CE7D527|nr:MarR family winged helix-turn-helix transcriptional regulator [Kaistia algarum]MCX5513694.1 MarR family winged helix-turn-helix transcriptional regulator [Kaistia algarum]PPE79430.1 MarR family transcriptional regulator [Kaistia algarum]